MIDLLEQTTSARWTSKRGFLSRSEDIIFNGANSDSRGFARMESNALCEDGERRNVLFMHPRWTTRGSTIGDFDIRVPNGAVLTIELGYLAGAFGSDGVEYEIFVMAENPATRRRDKTRVFRLNKTYTRRWVESTVDLSFWSGQDVTLRLQVNAGTSSGQDWAAWSTVTINENVVRNRAQRWRFAATQLVVEDRNERSGGGDDPMLATVYFRSRFGKPGSTVTVVRDRLIVLEDNVKEGVRIPITDNDRLAIDDIISSEENGISGYFIGAFEEDQNGIDTIRTTIRDITIRVADALVANVEANSTAYLNPEELIRALEDAVEGSGLGGGGKRFLKWIARAHDFVGLNGVIFISGQIAPFYTGSPDETEKPKSPLSERNFSLLFEGADARYRITVNSDRL